MEEEEGPKSRTNMVHSNNLGISGLSSICVRPRARRSQAHLHSRVHRVVGVDQKASGRPQLALGLAPV